MKSFYCCPLHPSHLFESCKINTKHQKCFVWLSGKDEAVNIPKYVLSSLKCQVEIKSTALLSSWATSSPSKARAVNLHTRNACTHSVGSAVRPQTSLFLFYLHESLSPTEKHFRIQRCFTAVVSQIISAELLGNCWNQRGKKGEKALSCTKGVQI